MSGGDANKLVLYPSTGAVVPAIISGGEEKPQPSIEQYKEHTLDTTILSGAIQFCELMNCFETPELIEVTLLIVPKSSNSVCM
jgi:hypothetical protein